MQPRADVHAAAAAAIPFVAITSIHVPPTAIPTATEAIIAATPSAPIAVAAAAAATCKRLKRVAAAQPDPQASGYTPPSLPFGCRTRCPLGGPYPPPPPPRTWPPA